MRSPVRASWPILAQLARGSVVVLLSVSYFSYVFQINHRAFWEAGIGSWLDSYFINFLLEHWNQSLWTFGDPSSPPMYHPARGTLGYSHGLVLYVPFYSAVRPFVHPFQAHNLTLFLVMLTGTICLYLIFRRLKLSLVESLVLTAFFVSSHNVIDGWANVWSQRASVFLIPPVLLVLLISRDMPATGPRLMLAWLSGLLATLLFTQDYYTGQFALFFVVMTLLAARFVDGQPPVGETVVSFWRRERGTGVRVALVIATLAAAWTAYLWMAGGGAVEILGVTIRSSNWRRPAVLTLVGLAAFVYLRGGIDARAVFERAGPWGKAFALGGFIGGLVFLWIYLGAFREHPSFPEEQLIGTLKPRNPRGWRAPTDVLTDLAAYDTQRAFKLVFGLCLLAWIPWFKVDRKGRLYGLWFLVVSVAVLLVPLSFNGLSIWRMFFEGLPGFSVIRDPRRIIYLYELAAVLVTGLLLARLAHRWPHRIAVTALALLLLAMERNEVVFTFERPNDIFDRRVSAPIAVDASCESFFIKGASNLYMSRSGHMWSLYGVDSMFIALNYSLPTVNGYSAWSPEGWGLANPQEAGYAEALRQWIDRYGLHGVCELDIERRTMRPSPQE